jgi:hypothetical protein
MEDYFLYEIENNLSNELCNNIISKFDEDENKYDTLVENCRKSSGLKISNNANWKTITEVLFEQLMDGFEKYKQNITNNSFLSSNYEENEFEFIEDKILNNLLIYELKICKYKRNDGFVKWHADSLNRDTSLILKQYRLIGFIWYLNDVDIGGETEFLYKKKIKPTAGKLLLFPSTWTYIHKGNTPISSDKYIIVGWVGYPFYLKSEL